MFTTKNTDLENYKQAGKVIDENPSFGIKNNSSNRQFIGYLRKLKIIRGLEYPPLVHEKDLQNFFLFAKHCSNPLLIEKIKEIEKETD